MLFATSTWLPATGSHSLGMQGGEAALTALAERFQDLPTELPELWTAATSGLAAPAAASQPQVGLSCAALLSSIPSHQAWALPMLALVHVIARVKVASMSATGVLDAGSSEQPAAVRHHRQGSASWHGCPGRTAAAACGHLPPALKCSCQAGCCRLRHSSQQLARRSPPTSYGHVRTFASLKPVFCTACCPPVHGCPDDHSQPAASAQPEASFKLQLRL